MRSKNNSAPPPHLSKTTSLSHTVTIGEFEGPLGLLLELVEKGNMEVTAISVATITTQYLDRLGRLQDQSPEHLSEFLQLGARLLYIKSLALAKPPSSTPKKLIASA
jgi:segregation and condensation protein A